MNSSALRTTAFYLLLFLSTGTLFGQQGQDKHIKNVVRNTADNSLKSLSFTESAGWKQDQSQAIFNTYLGIEPGGNVALVLRNKVTTKSKTNIQRFDEYYKGIKVAYGGFTISGKEDNVSFLTGNFYAPETDLSAVPVISASVAFDRALGFVGADKYKWQNPIEEAFIKRETGNNDTSYLPKAQLVWVEDFRSGNKDHKLHLAYSFNIYAEEPLSRQEVYVDAMTGSILFSNQLLKHTAANGNSRYSGNVPFQSAFVGGTYRLYDSTRGSGVYTRNMNNGTSYGAATQFTSATNTWPSAPIDNVALDAHWGGEMVYDYWLTEHGRLSWDNLDGILLQYVHFNTNYNNAYWNGVSMTYGDGTGLAAGGFSPLTSLDVTAHEVGHGVCEATCNLIYESESGALNEAFSDCWGATIENWANPHEVDAMPKEPWDIGEEIGTEPLRSMSTPLLQGQPDTYGGTNWTNVVGCTPTGGNDYCGVHRNSGLMNYWYYLLVLGGTGVNDNTDSYIVNALGWTKSAIILYETELVLSSTADYMDCRTASINVANTLWGPCSFEAQCVTSAWFAVGVGPDYNPCTPQISFVTSSVRVSETAPTATCPASKTLNISLVPNGPVISGGNPVATLVVASSNAVAGVDYTLSSNSVTFPAGSTAPQNITMTIFDNGAVNDDKRIDFAVTVNPMGSTAIVAPYNDTLTVFIDNDDSVPHQGGILYPVLDDGIPVVSDFSSPFFGSRRRARSQFLVYASELAAAGVVPGAPISQIAFNVLTKNSTGPFTNYTVSMRNTTNTDLYANFVGGLTTVYSGDHTTSVGLDVIDFNMGSFVWDGTSNVVVQLCFGMTPATFPGNDLVSGVQQGAYIIGGYTNSNTGSGTGCGLGFNGGNRMVVRPWMRFMQTVAPAPIETTVASNRNWDVRAGQEVYFYNPADGEVIAGIKGMDNDLGCVNATVSQAGNGLVPASFSPINRSLKEVTITPTINGGITTYDVTIYMNNTELAGVLPSSLFLLKTTAPTDATITPANSLVLTPTLITGGDYTGFRATYTGFSRYMLVDGPLCNAPNASITPTGPTSFCLGGTVGLNATPTGAGLSYQWLKDGIAIPGATTTSFTASLGGDYRVRVSAFVCDSVSLPVTVILDSAYAAPIAGATSNCIGMSTTLTDATSGGVWSSTNTAVATINSTGTVTGTGAGTTTISYVVTNACGTASATHTMTINAPTALSANTGTLSVCTGLTTTLSNSTMGGAWMSTNAAVATIDAAGNVTGMMAGTATMSYMYTNSFGCSSSAASVVSVNATPVAGVSPAGPIVICSSTSTLLSATPAAGHTYQWLSSGAPVPGATNNTFSTSSAGDYQVVATNLFGCSGTSAVVNITIDPAAVVVPAVSITASTGLTICATAAPVTFTAAPVNGGGSPVYAWSVNGTPVGGAGGTYAYVPANGDLIACQLTSSAACALPPTASTSVIMTVMPFVTPSVSINALPNDTVCTDDMVTYAAVPNWGGTAPEYLWTENGINVATGPLYLTWPLDGDVIVCEMTSNYPCLVTNVATSAPLTMHVLTPTTNSVTISASSTMVAAGAPVTFIAVAPNGGATPAYQWFVSGVAVPGATNMTFTTSSLTNGQIVSCQVTSSLVCALPNTAVSNGVVMGVAAGVENVASGKEVLTLVPNPNKGTFNILGAGFVQGEQVAISVVNMLGQEVYKNSVQVQGSDLEATVVLPAGTAPGMYIVSALSGSARAVFHVVVKQ